ncbi:MAG TPA: dienelactone hydrolase family protein [Thermoplasmataceae archaeon]|nr:dienelactone hydrolase family protein [Thermoplasmatales archaeon AK]HLH85241.1 dienelactone hydrolase family protein [Thermoplasmataceae archaeon]
MAGIKEHENWIKSFDGTDMKYFSAEPDDGKSHPGILVIQEIWGLTDFIRNFSRKLAQSGYVTFAPHLYSRKDQIDVFTEENIMDAMRPFWSIPPEKRNDQKTINETLGKMSENAKKIVDKVMFHRKETEAQMIKDLHSAYDHLFSRKNVTKRGVIGFCLGGGLSFQLSTEKAFDATAVFYGANPKNIDDLQKIKGSVLGIYAGEDSNINNGLPALIEGVVKHKVDFEMKIYPGTYHAFFNDTGMSYHKEASAEAMERTLRFFKKHLGD